MGRLAADEPGVRLSLTYKFVLGSTCLAAAAIGFPGLVRAFGIPVAPWVSFFAACNGVMFMYRRVDQFVPAMWRSRAAARLRHVAGTKWSAKRYMNIDLLKQQRMTAWPDQPPNQNKL